MVWTSRHQDFKSPDEELERTLGTVLGLSVMVGSGILPVLEAREQAQRMGPFYLTLKSGMSTEYGPELSLPQLS